MGWVVLAAWQEVMDSDATGPAQELQATRLGPFGALRAGLGWPEPIEYLQKNMEGVGF